VVYGVKSQGLGDGFNKKM